MIFILFFFEGAMNLKMFIVVCHVTFIDISHNKREKFEDFCFLIFFRLNRVFFICIWLMKYEFTIDLSKLQNISDSSIFSFQVSNFTFYKYSSSKPLTSDLDMLFDNCKIDRVNFDFTQFRFGKGIMHCGCIKYKIISS